jgi:hypothetical protein
MARSAGALLAGLVRLAPFDKLSIGGFMTTTNFLVPPRELVREWYGSEDCPDGANALANYLCTQAAQWGADQELEACCEWIPKRTSWDAERLRAARRPRSPSLKEQALELVRRIEGAGSSWALSELGVVRRALEALDD